MKGLTQFLVPSARDVVANVALRTKTDREVWMQIEVKGEKTAASASRASVSLKVGRFLVTCLRQSYFMFWIMALGVKMRIDEKMTYHRPYMYADGFFGWPNSVIRRLELWCCMVKASWS